MDNFKIHEKIMKISNWHDFSFSDEQVNICKIIFGTDVSIL